MAGFMDKLKGMFGDAKEKAGPATEKAKVAATSAKEKAGPAAASAKKKADELVDKAGDKVPTKVKQTYDKVSEQADKVLPGAPSGAEPTEPLVPADDPNPSSATDGLQPDADAPAAGDGTAKS